MGECSINDNRTTFLNRLAEEREKKGWRQEELAWKLQARSQTISNWENGRATPSFETMMKLADLYGTDLDYLTGRLNEPTHDIHFICEQTGLSPEAVQKLMYLKGSVMDEILSDILTHPEIDDLLSHTRMAVDEVEMWWTGLLEVKPVIGLNGYMELSDFIASKSFLKVLDDIRKQYTNRHGSLMDRLPEAVKASEVREVCLKLIEECPSDESMQALLSGMKDDPEKPAAAIAEMWRRYQDGEDLRSLSYAEFMNLISKQNREE